MRARTVRVTGVKFEETILAWDEGARWAFRVDSAQAPVFDAFVEDYHFEPDGSDATLLPGPSPTSRDSPSNWLDLCCRAS